MIFPYFRTSEARNAPNSFRSCRRGLEALRIEPLAPLLDREPRNEALHAQRRPFFFEPRLFYIAARPGNAAQTAGTSLVERPRESAPAQQLHGLGPFGHDIRDGVADQLVGLFIFQLADRSGEAEFRDEKLVPQAGGIDVVGQAGPILERKAAEIGEAAEHRPDAGREFPFDAAELRVQIHDLWHFHRCRLTVSVPFDRWATVALATGPIGQKPGKGFPKT